MSGPDVFGESPYFSKTDVVGQVVAVLRGVTDQRGLQIEGYRSRAVRAGDVHELMITDEPADIGKTVNHVALIAFFEVTQGGVLLQHDRVTIDGADIGRLAGFNETHMPNHQNICLVGIVQDGAALGVTLCSEVRVSRP
ncbi:MAG TPA: hypothetical protein VMM78_03600 [Thermomicrobiales bacterium]|nr:hypothetical protein [Thermomicrobiales bacterium]